MYRLLAITDNLIFYSEVVEDARQTFASSSTHELATLPSLPVAPLSRSASHNRTNRSSRLPRKVLAASQIFTDDDDRSAFDLSNITGSYATANNTTTEQSEGRSLLQLPVIYTPSRPRRATVSICSPEKTLQTPPDMDIETGSPSKRREKSKSHGNLFQLHIAPISFLEAEINKRESVPTKHVCINIDVVPNVSGTSSFRLPPLTGAG